MLSSRSFFPNRLNLIRKALGFHDHRYHHQDWASLLRGCRSIGEVELANRRIWAEGYGGDRFLSNCLVQAYAACGDLQQARAVFDRIPHKNDFSWNIMISGYAKQGQPAVAIDLYRRLEQQQRPIGAFVYATVLGACSSLGDLQQGKLVHFRSIDDGAGMDSIVATAAMKMYSSCGCLDLAAELFERIPRKDPVAWTAMLSAYAQNGHPLEALLLYRRMLLDGFLPDAFTFTSVLGACAAVGDLPHGKQIHLHSVCAGLSNTIPVQNGLLNLYAKCGDAAEASAVFEVMAERDSASWGLMILAYAQSGHIDQALRLYERMEAEGSVQPDSGVFVRALAACSSFGDLQRGKQIHARIVKLGLQGEKSVQSALTNMYASCGSLEDATKAFEATVEKDAVCWTSMLAAYAQLGHGHRALELVERMEQEGVEPNEISITCAIASCTTIQQARAIHQNAASKGLDSIPAVQIALLNLYAKCGSLKDAAQIFERIQIRDLVAWTAMAAAYAQHGDYEQAVRTCQTMELEGVDPDELTYGIVLTACSQAGLIEHGRERFHSIQADRGLQPTVQHYGSMIDLLGRSGRIADAQELLCSMPYQADAITCTTLAAACRNQNDLQRIVISAPHKP